ncbi:hypothetical protein E1295_33265 [Nonomuraea mesophila]|uniref:Uncharacterized protein n=1 Tax=Nonomuraea mesophila TaxID=2530382 RepID=A0A4R5EVR7_9ACTN|nr:hypothetical protein [Nonomuraea mesophila]TDE38827.1 hypothetical protein E1295_33265 [Nonomuraea mesophila]
MRRLIVCLALALLPASCGWSLPASPGASSEAFEVRARDVAERWQGSAADRAWRHGFVALDVLNPRGWNHVGRVPAWVNRSAHNGAWRLDAELPTGPPADAEVRWPDGARSRVPLIAAASAYEEFSRPAGLVEEQCPAKGCRPLRVTGVELGRVPLETSRGPVRVPAWMFTVKGVEQKKVHVAVDPSAVSARPERVEGGVEEVMAYDLVAGRPHDLLLRYGHGACDTVRGVRVHETDQVVVVGVDKENAGPGEPCPAILESAVTTVALARPLGERLVLDSGTGVPVLRGPVRR